MIYDYVSNVNVRGRGCVGDEKCKWITDEFLNVITIIIIIIIIILIRGACVLNVCESQK